MKLPLFLIVFALPQLGAANFHGFNFNNFSYPYRFWNGRNVQVPLQNGKHEYDIKIDRGFFRLAHFYVADVTGDGRPEAIVVLWHSSCGASCDGGSALFYIYRFQNQKLKLVWRYETGSLAYGCGLKSFVAKGTTLTVEQFGRCTRRNRNLNETSLTGKFQVDGVTRITLKSNGSRFVARKREFFSTPERSVLNYELQIDIAH